MNKEKLHIVFILANCNTAPYFNWFAEESSKRKDLIFSFVALTSEFPQMLTDIEKYGSKGFWIKFNHNKRSTHMIRVCWQLYKLFKKINPSVVHTHLFDDSLPGLIAAKLSGVKIRVITKGDTAYHYNYASKWIFFDKINNTIASHIIAPSGESKKFILEKEKCNPKKLFLIHHGIPTISFLKIDTNASTLFKKQYNLIDKFVIGNISRFIEWKNQIDILKAALILKETIPNLYIVLVGQGNYINKIQAFINENQMKSYVKIIEWIDYSDIPLLYSSFDVFIHAAHMEPFGFVIAEAMMSGLPVVSTPTGAALDSIITKENGYLAQYHHPESLAEGVVNFYKNYPQRPYIKAQETALKLFDFQIMYNNYSNLYFNKYS